MSSKKKAQPPKPPTGISKRLREAMKLRSIDNEADLLRLIQAQAPGDDNEEFRRRSLTQQMVNHVLNGEAERSYFTPFIAAALQVSTLWLGWGIGPRVTSMSVKAEDHTDDEAARRGRRVSGGKS